MKPSHGPGVNIGTIAGGTPWSFDHDQSLAPLAATEAANVATAYCAQMGKTMLLDGMEQHGSASVGRYRCI
jgi:hypothetical protein